MSDDFGPNEPDGALVPLDRPGGRTQWTFSHAGRSYAVFSADGELHVTDGACPMYVAGLVALHPGQVEFRHPLARSAIYADAPVSQRREAHRTLAAALRPDGSLA